MPHRRPLRVQARRACGALVLSLMASAVACSPRASVTVVVDTTRAGGEQEVFALPVAPERIRVALPGEPRPAFGTPRGDSIARLLALEDSVAEMDARFQRERSALNEAAASLAELDRRSDEYARRYDAHRVRLLDAERRRATRDRLRERARALRQRLGDAAPPDDATRRLRAMAARREALTSAVEGERETRIGPMRDGRATLELEPGSWWIGTTERGAAPSTFTRIEVAEGARDTLRLPLAARTPE